MDLAMDIDIDTGAEIDAGGAEGGPAATAPAHRYRITHRTAYTYDTAVAAGHTIARLTPRRLPHQEVHASEIGATPAPDHRRSHVDGFGNVVTYLSVDAPHDHLEIVARSEVTVRSRPIPGGMWHAPWEDAVTATAVSDRPDGVLARLCRLDSPLVHRGADLAAFAATELTPGRPLGEATSALSGRIFDTFEFVPGATDVSTPVADVLADRRGVCQDFAHLLLGALRSVGLGARYVSGYLETEPPPGEPRLVGADASHAWVGLFVPGGGWVDLDPTNGLVQPERHVTVGWGRDYTDVVPVRGVVFGPPAEQQLTVSVDVAPV
jgi:transglutaminase-like putative cysteine protease